MSKPAGPPPRPPSKPGLPAASTGKPAGKPADIVVEMDAMDVVEWEHGQRTPQASDANLAALVKETKPASAEAPRPAVVQRARTSGPIGPQPTGTRPPEPVRTRPLASVVPPSVAPPVVMPPSTEGPTVVSGAKRSRPRPSDAVPRPPDVASRPSEPPPASGGSLSRVSEPAVQRATPDIARFGLSHATTASAPRLLDEVAPRETPVPTGVPLPLPAPAESSPVLAPVQSLPVQSLPLPAPVQSPTVLGVAASPLPSMTLPAQREPAVERSSQDRPIVAAVAPPQAVGESAAAGYQQLAGGPDGEPGAVRTRRRSRRGEPDASVDRQAPASASSRKRYLWITGAAVVALAVVLAFVATSGDGHGPAAAPEPSVRGPDVAAAPAAGSPTQPPAPPAEAPAGSPPAETPAAAAAASKAAPAASASAAADSPAEAAPGDDDQPAPSAHGKRVAFQSPNPPTARKLGHKKVVVDYTARPNDPPTPGLIAQVSEDPAIGLARNAYMNGNQRLFTGDLVGAIGAYRLTLRLYPGYVGGYRGLGLAYEQRGEAAKAIEAFDTYVSAAPNAKDVALIRRRIAHLQGK